MKTNIVIKMLIGLCLTFVVGGCEKQQKKTEETFKTGEAFVVLKSGEVLHMADMEVVYLKLSFRTDFVELKQRYQIRRQSLVHEIEIGHSAQIDNQVAELQSRISRISNDESKIFDTLFAAITSEREKLVSEMPKLNDAFKEYKQILELADKRIKELCAGNKEKEEKTILADEMVRKINAYIVESQLAVAKLDSDYEVFQTSGDIVYLFNDDIKATYQKWRRTKSETDDILDERIRAEKRRRKEMLISWGNRHGFSNLEGQHLENLAVQREVSLARLDEQLNDFKTGGAKSRSLVKLPISVRAHRSRNRIGCVAFIFRCSAVSVAVTGARPRLKMATAFSPCVDNCFTTICRSSLE